ncbi:MAG TPA: hypothetical protein VMV31_03755 [Terriglobales bacterium]|nr:hypothetical protein [Terriglobales bacterium]
MSSPHFVRASRDGDQFHYLWAVRRCLGLLKPDRALVAISIEGPSPNELPSGSAPLAGECTIDVAEYDGSEALERANAVRYLQLKHSTYRTDKVWTKSELKPTLAAFGGRFQDLVRRFVADEVHRKFEFWFVTNRPVSQTIRDAVIHGAMGLSSCSSDETGLLVELTGLDEAAISGFCSLLRLEDGHAAVSRILPQSAGPFTAATIKGTFAVSTLPIFAAPVAPPMGIAPWTNETGMITFDGTSSFSATLDAAQPGVAQGGLAAADSYAVASNGRVTTGSGNQVLYIVSPTRVLLLQIQANNPNPTIQDLRQ